jgi:hypothetical protein
MTLRLYIDPGKHFHACAIFRSGALASVQFIAPAAFGSTSFLQHTDAIVIEKPQVYLGADEKNPNDLLDVYGAARMSEGMMLVLGGPAAHYVLPREWKGSFKKPSHHRQVWAALSQQEREIFARDAGHEVDFIHDKIEAACERLARTGKVTGYSWKAHNLLDAVGLGLWHHRRLRGRVAPPSVAKV